MEEPRESLKPADFMPGAPRSDMVGLAGLFRKAEFAPFTFAYSNIILLRELAAPSVAEALLDRE